MRLTGDERVLMEAKNRIRHEFRSAPKTTPTDPEFQKRMHYANDIATLLRANVVQGVPEGDNIYSKMIPVYQVPVAGWFLQVSTELRIHEETERGDNESINNTKTSGAGAGCCSS